MGKKKTSKRQNAVANSATPTQDSQTEVEQAVSTTAIVNAAYSTNDDYERHLRPRQQSVVTRGSGSFETRNGRTPAPVFEDLVVAGGGRPLQHHGLYILLNRWFTLRLSLSLVHKTGCKRIDKSSVNKGSK